MQKRAEMTIEVLVALTIGLFVLGFSIYGFSTNWNMLGGKVCLLGGYDSNVEAIQNKCKLACLENDNETYCDKEIKLKLNDNEVVIGTCNDLSKKTIQGVNIEICPGLCKKIE